VDNGAVMDDKNTPDVLPSGHLHADAQTLARMLQEQLDVINDEIRFRISLSTESRCSSVMKSGSL